MVNELFGILIFSEEGTNNEFFFVGRVDKVIFVEEEEYFVC